MRDKTGKKLRFFLSCLFVAGMAMLTICGKPNEVSAASNSNMIMADVKNSSNATGWYLTKYGNYYYYKNGKIQQGWLTLNDQKFYLDADRNGAMSLGWKNISDDRYYFRKQQKGFQWIGSAMQSRWYKSQKGYYYYFTSDGSLATLWQKINGKYYYFRPLAKNGNPKFSKATGWLKSGNNTYYLGSNGVRQTGLKTIDGNKYYFNSSGKMQTGWVTINGKKYYFNSSGIMQTNRWIDATYYVGNDGALIENYNGTSTAGLNFRWPLSSSWSYISSYFGNRESPGGIGSTNHKGIDIPATTGTPIYAVAAGTIVTRQTDSGFGNWIQISHSGPLRTEYAHMSKFQSGLAVGDKVKKGQLIGYVGSTGNSTGPHLHFGVILNGERVDPMNYVKQPG